MKEFEVTVLIRNNRLKRRRLELGMTQAQMAKACGVNISVWSEYERLVRDPLAAPKEMSEDDAGEWKSYYTWRDDAQKIANFFCVEPETLWPDLARKVLSNKTIREVSATDMNRFIGEGSLRATKALPSKSVTSMRNVPEKIEEVMAEVLSPREQAVVKKYFQEEKGLKEIGDEGLPMDNKRPQRGTKKEYIGGAPLTEHPSRERVRQILNKSLKRMRHPSVANLLRPAIEEGEENGY